jgi:hypothetical protein
LLEDLFQLLIPPLVLILWRLRGHARWFEGSSNVLAGNGVGDAGSELGTKLDLGLHLCHEIHIIGRRLAFSFAMFEV